MIGLDFVLGGNKMHNFHVHTHSDHTDSMDQLIKAYY